MSHFPCRRLVCWSLTVSNGRIIYFNQFDLINFERIAHHKPFSSCLYPYTVRLSDHSYYPNNIYIYCPDNIQNILSPGILHSAPLNPSAVVGNLSDSAAAVLYLFNCLLTPSYHLYLSLSSLSLTLLTSAPPTHIL